MTAAFAFDLESDLWQPGLPTPYPVCGSLAWRESNGGVSTALFTAEEALAWYKANVGKVRITGANIQYDNSLMVVMSGDFELLCAVFDAYDRGMFSDVQVREMLNLIGQGCVDKNFITDPRGGGVLMDPGTGKKAERLSLATVHYIRTGSKEAKKNADYRRKYARLRGMPLGQWPVTAREYPLDDVRNTLVDHELQEAGGAGLPAAMNLQNECRQLRAAWAIRLATMWGLRTDAGAVAAVEARVSAKLEAAKATYAAVGFRREDGTENTRAVARAVAEAYGDRSPCATCEGTGQVLHAVQPKRATTPRHYKTCARCQGTGLHLLRCPRTPAGGVKADRDTLEESGNELLEKYAWVSNDEKFAGTYLPYLKQATTVPMNPEGNVLVATGRTSYNGLIQLIPRGGGLRECFVPREGYVYCSIDYAALELSTLAQVTTWVVGWSAMADAINDGQDLHVKFAASMVGETYDNFKAAVKRGDKKMKGYRQAAKAANFGFPGGMGPPKLVSAKRKEGLRFCITLGEAPLCGCSDPSKCRRCHGRGALCGVEMIHEWNGNPCPPVCKRCCELADQLRTAWFRQWPEIRPYFAYISRMTKSVGALEQFVSRRVRGGVDFCNGANTLFQGLAADGAKHALWLVSKECYTDRGSQMFGARPVIFVHDEIFSEMPVGIASQAAERMTRVMVDGMSEFVPDVRISAEPTLMDRWYKEAECKRSPDGKLLVWRPGEKMQERDAEGKVLYLHKHYDPATREVFEERKAA